MQLQFAWQCMTTRASERTVHQEKATKVQVGAGPGELMLLRWDAAQREDTGIKAARPLIVEQKRLQAAE